MSASLVSSGLRNGRSQRLRRPRIAHGLAAETFGDEVDEKPQPARDEAFVRIESVEAEVSPVMVIEHWNQPPLADVASANKAR